MNLTELEKLADESPIIVTMATQHLKQLIALCRLQNEALMKYTQRQSMEDLEYAGYAADEAIAVYEQMKEEKSNV
jgi:protein-tyrosine-phosphatase